jgi:hypothetical protein
MGRYKSVEIKGLFFDNFGELLESTLLEAIKDSKLSGKEILEKLTPKLNDLIASYEDSVSTLYLDNHKFNLDNFLKVHFKNQKTIAETNKDSFIPFFLYINGCVVAYEKIVKQIDKKHIDSTLKMNIALYGLVIRRAQEIGDLLLSGYIDGSMIIWRSLYEYSIILLVLAIENDTVLTDKFYKHSFRQSRKKVKSYETHFKDLKFKPLPYSTQKNLEKKEQDLNDKYGKDFIENEFGWADDLFPGKQKASLRLLEQRVEMSRFRPYYLLCSEHIHPDFNGLHNYMEKNRIILPRLLKQDLDLKSFIDPMQFTISILHEINDYILYEFSTQNEYVVNISLMRKIFEKQQDSFDNKK